MFGWMVQRLKMFVERRVRRCIDHRWSLLEVIIILAYLLEDHTKTTHTKPLQKSKPAHALQWRHSSCEILQRLIRRSSEIFALGWQPFISNAD